MLVLLAACACVLLATATGVALDAAGACPPQSAPLRTSPRPVVSHHEGRASVWV